MKKTLSARENLERVKLKPVVLLNAKAYNPCVISHGKQPHFRKIEGKYETLHSNLMDSYLFYSETSAANSEIVMKQAKGFVNEKEDIRKDNNNILLLIDGYGGSCKIRVDRVIVVALSPHTSHVLQPLDVTFFNAYSLTCKKSCTVRRE